LSDRTVPVRRYETFRGDLFRSLRRLPVRGRAGPGNHLEVRQHRELAAHLVRHSVGEVVVFGSSQVLEREDGHASRTCRPSRTLSRRAKRIDARRGQEDGDAKEDRNEDSPLPFGRLRNYP
jgi:hypothetical protein